MSLLHPEFGMRLAYLFMAISALKTDFLIPISADEKGCYFRFRILANHLASFFCQAISSDYLRSQNANICWLSFWPGFVTSAARNWPTFLFLFLTVSLWRPVNSNTEGVGEIPYFSPSSGRPRDNIISVVDCRLIFLLYLGKILVCLKNLSAVQEASDENFLLAIFSCL